jgi:hypothetical protein
MLPPPRPTPDFDVDRGPPVHFALLTTLVALVAFAREGRREDARACARGVSTWIPVCSSTKEPSSAYAMPSSSRRDGKQAGKTRCLKEICVSPASLCLFVFFRSVVEVVLPTRRQRLGSSMARIWEVATRMAPPLLRLTPSETRTSWAILPHPTSPSPLGRLAPKHA